MRTDQALIVNRLRPTLGFPTWSRHAVGKRREQHHQAIQDAEDEECLRNSGLSRSDDVHAGRPLDEHLCDVIGADNDHFTKLSANIRELSATVGLQGNITDRPQVIGGAVECADQEFFQRRADHGAAAEAHDGHAGSHPPAVREPLDQSADGRDISQPQSAASNDPIAEVEQPELMCKDPESTKKESTTPTDSRHRTHHPRSDLLEPASGDRCGKAETDDRDGKDPHDLRERPVVSRAGSNAINPGQSRIENAPGVNRANAEVNGDGSRWDPPAIETRFRDDVLFRESANHATPLLEVSGRSGFGF